MWRIFIIILLLYFYAVSAFANTYADAKTALDTGQFEQAHQDARALGTDAGLVLAAEALNAKLLLGLSPSPSKTAKSAMKLAQAALKQDASNADAQLQYAIAYGFYGRQVSVFKAWRKKIPLKIRKEINAAIATNPQDYRTHALLGAWHLSVVQRAGAGRAEKYFGATQEQGVAAFELALQHLPDDIIILANYTLMRYVLDPQSEREWARNNLQRIGNLPTPTAVEAQVQIQIAEILAALDQAKTAQGLAKKFITR